MGCNVREDRNGKYEGDGQKGMLKWEGALTDQKNSQEACGK